MWPEKVKIALKVCVLRKGNDVRIQEKKRLEKNIDISLKNLWAKIGPYAVSLFSSRVIQGQLTISPDFLIKKPYFT